MKEKKFDLSTYDDECMSRVLAQHWSKDEKLKKEKKKMKKSLAKSKIKKTKRRS